MKIILYDSGQDLYHIFNKLMCHIVVEWVHYNHSVISFKNYLLSPLHSLWSIRLLQSLTLFWAVLSVA